MSSVSFGFVGLIWAGVVGFILVRMVHSCAPWVSLSSFACALRFAGFIGIDAWGWFVSFWYVGFVRARVVRRALWGVGVRHVCRPGFRVCWGNSGAPCGSSGSCCSFVRALGVVALVRGRVGVVKFIRARLGSSRVSS